jgi:hemerythrin
MSSAHRIPPSGNLLIDHQHARLNELIQLATLAARDSGGTAAFEQALTEFRHTLAHHFAVEKVIYSGAGFDAANAHDRAHAVILEQLDACLRSAPPLAMPHARHHLLDELERILLDHEMLEDATYWDAIRAHSCSPTLKWTELMTIGIDWVDEQHQHMVDLLNQLSQAVRANDPIASASLLQQFLQQTRSHFAAEEAYLESLGTPLSTHRAEHARMLAELTKLEAAGSHGLGVLVDHYLRFWVIEHILGIDRQDLIPGQ